MAWPASRNSAHSLKLLVIFYVLSSFIEAQTCFNVFYSKIYLTTMVPDIQQLPASYQVPDTRNQVPIGY